MIRQRGAVKDGEHSLTEQIVPVLTVTSDWYVLLPCPVLPERGLIKHCQHGYTAREQHSPASVCSNGFIFLSLVQLILC